MSNSFERLAAALRAATAATLISALAACGGSGDTIVAGAGTASCEPADPATAADCSQLLVAVTDADGDFVSYVVDVLSITLQRPAGGSVETLPASTRVDFANLTELSELLSAATLAPGDFVGGTIRIDYSNAEIFVESAGGIVPAQAVDAAGTPLGVVDVEVRLADRDHLILTRGRTALLSIDFDLAASHHVDLTSTPALLTTEPFIVAEVRPLTEKELRVRGALIDVDVANQSYDIRVRPWHRRDGDFGELTVHTTATTEFEIGDSVLTGDAGLTALDGLAAGTMTVAFGTLDTQQHRFTAEIVRAGDSIGGDLLAAVHGNVVARSGDTLTVKGALAVYRDRPAHFRRTVMVELGPDTKVSKVGDPGATLAKDDISVGQRIVALGQFTNAAASDDDPLAPDVALVLDATQGRVRMQLTQLHGTVRAVNPGEISLELRAIDRLGIDMFDFSGTGSGAGSDADPLDYQVATSTLSAGGLEVGKWARVQGFVAPFGLAPPDFFGRTLIDHRDIPVIAGIGWGLAGTAAPFAVMDASGLVLDLTNPDIGSRHHLLLGRRIVDLYDLPAPLTAAPSATRGLYSIWEPGHVELFIDFAAFVDELSLRLGSGSKAQALAASGSFDEASTTLAASRIAVHMSTATP
jgi:hypothetical protein